MMEKKFHVLVFKTNMHLKKDAKKIKPLLHQLSSIKNWNIDRDDEDKILRIESETLCQDEIINILHTAGYHCEELL
jgi:hypothetical protein